VRLVAPEYIAHATLQKSGLLVVVKPKHFEKMMQRGPITPQVTTSSRALAIWQPLIQKPLDMGVANLPPPQPTPKVLDDADIGSAMRWDMPTRHQVLRVLFQDQTNRFGAETPADVPSTALHDLFRR